MREECRNDTMNREGKQENVLMHSFRKEDVICDFILKEGFSDGVISSENYHFHSFFEIHYVLNGRMHIMIDDQDMELHCGDVCIIPPKMVHYIYPDEGSHRVGFRFFYKQMKGGEQNGLFARFQNAFGGLGQAYILQERELFQQCIHASRKAFSETAPANIVDELLFIALDVLSYSVLETDVEKKTYPCTYTDSFLTEQIEDYLNSHYQGVPKLEELADSLKLSVRQTQRVIFRLFGMNFSRLVTAKRLTVARFLLHRTGSSIEEIACRVGFCDKPYFYRKFSACYGITPVQYRKEHLR